MKQRLLFLTLCVCLLLVAKVSAQTPTVNISANPAGAICAGTQVTFTANVQNGGYYPSYQWYKNGSAIANETASTYVTSSLTSGDQVYVSYTYYSTSMTTSNLKFYFDAENNTSYRGTGTSWNDLSVNSTNATFGNATFGLNQPTFISTSPKSFQFTKTGQGYGKNGASISNVLGDDMTVAAWIRTTDSGNNTLHFKLLTILCSEKPGGNSDWGFGINNSGQLAFGNGPGSDVTIASSTQVNTGDWVYVAATRQKSNGQIKLYIDGSLATTGTSYSGNTLDAWPTILIGDGGDYPSHSFGGNLAAVQGYDRVLSATELSNNINARTSKATINSNTITTTLHDYPTISLTSAAGTVNQTNYINTPPNNITPITFSTTNATSATFSGLPNGVSGDWSNNVITISGSALETGIVTYNYSITATGNCETTISPGTIKVYLPPSFILNPSSEAKSLCSGSASLNVEVDGGGDVITSYQWYRVTTPVNYGGTLVSTISTAATTNVFIPTEGTYYYYAVVTMNGGATATSQVSGAITVFGVPSISSGPSSAAQSICVTGGSFTDLSINASAGSGNIDRFKWYNNSTNSTTGGTIASTIVNGISPNVFSPSTSELGTKYYYCEVINSNGCSIKSAVSGALTVSPDSVAGTASASSLFLGSNGTANLNLSGSTGSIQWQQSSDGVSGWASVSGGTGSNTANYSKVLTQTTFYRALVTSGNCSAVTSNVIKITITSTPITSTGIVAPVCFSATTRTSTLPYTAASGLPNSYTIDWDATANTAGFLDQTATSHTFQNGGGTATGIIIPANVPVGTYLGIMTVTNGSGNATQPITVAVGSVSGTISGSTTVASGTNSTVLTLNGYSGSIQWQQSNNNSTFINIPSATSATYTAVNLTSTTFYKAVVTRGSCASVTSPSASITVLSDATSFGVTGNSNPNTINNNTATVVDDSLVVTSNGMITGFTITITSDYTDGDILGYTGTLPSGITADPFNTTSRSLTFTGSASASIWQTLLRTVTLKSTSTCFPTNRKVSFLPSAKFYNYFNGHYYEYVDEGMSWTAAKAFAESKNYYGLKGYLVTISSEAENSYINSLIASNSWIGATDNFTQINAALGYTKYSSASAGEGKWHWVTGPEKGIQIRTGNASTASQSGSPIAGVYQNWNTTSTFASNEPNDVWGSSPGEEDYGHMYTGSGKWNDFPNRSKKSIIEYGGMAGDNLTSSISFTRDIIILGSPIGSVTGATTVCSGTNSTTLTYNGNGTLQRWEYSLDNFSTPGIVDTSSSSNSISVDNLTISRYYRAVITIAGCSNISSSTALINVATTNSGTISSLNNTICSGGKVTLTLNGNSGSILKWQYSTSSDFSSNVIDIIATDTTLMQPVGSSIGTFYYRAAVLNSNCPSGGTAYSAGYPVIVTSGIAPVGGTVNSISHCSGSNSGTLTLTGSTGTSYQWQVSTDGYGFVWNDVASTTTSYSYSGISSTTKYRVKVTNGSCGFVYSDEGTVMVNQGFAAGFVSGSSTVCSGNNNISLTLNDYLGTVQWQSSSDNTTYSNIDGATNSVYTPVNLINTTYYRALVTNGSCTAVPSVFGTITVKQSPTPTFTAQPGATAIRTSDVTYTTQLGQSNYIWTIPGTVGVDYSITSGGTTSDNSVVLKWLTTGTKTVAINYSNSNNCYASAAVSSIVTTVSPNPPSLSNFPALTKYFYDGSFTLIPPTSTSPGAFTYQSTNTNVATTSGRTITFISPGTTTITATQDQTALFQSASISFLLTVTGVTVKTRSGAITTTDLKYVNRSGALKTKKGKIRSGQIVIASTSAEIQTLTITNLSSTSATATGSVISDGGSNITARGFCWNTSTNPTIENSTTSETGTTGALTSTISGLSSGTTYYFRAYITNSSGTSYGNEISFIKP